MFFANESKIVYLVEAGGISDHALKTSFSLRLQKNILKIF
jgi:hypothetical protein